MNSFTVKIISTIRQPKVKQTIQLLSKVSSRKFSLKRLQTVAKKLVAQIEASKQRPFARALFGIGIRHVGKTMAEAIANAYPTMDVLMAASEEDLAAIDSLITAGHLILHHSEAFSKSYNPHYRIVDRQIFDNVIKERI